MVAERLFRPLGKESNAGDMDRQCDQVRGRHVRRPRCARGDLRERGDDPDLDQGAAHDLSVRELQELWRSWNVRRRSRATAQEFEFCARLEKQPEAQALESELLAKMDTLESVHVSWMLDQDRCFVYDLPVIGSDPRQCRMKLAGISNSSEVCT